MTDPHATSESTPTVPRESLATLPAGHHAGPASAIANPARSRTSSVLVASPAGGTGKSTVALGIINLVASATKVGVFRPVASSSNEPDYALELLLDHATATLDDNELCTGVTATRVREDPENALAEIVARYHDLARQCDAVIIIGSDPTDIGPSALSFDARIAANLQAPVMLVLSGERNPGAVAESARICLTEIDGAHAHPVAIIVNRCDPTRLAEFRDALSPTGLPIWAIPDVPLLTAPTMAELRDALDGELYSGDPELLHREATSMLVAGMTAEHILERLDEGYVAITPADRTDVLLAVVTAHEADGFPSLAGIILNGGLRPHPMIDKLLRGIRSTVPIITTDHGTYRTAELVSRTRGRMDRTATRKVDTALRVMKQHIDAPALRERLRLPVPSVVTPQMFEYRLLDRARQDRKHIVLPEGNDDRILRAAGRLLSRDVVNLTILGDESVIGHRAAELGVDLAGANVVDPNTSELLDEFSKAYTALRAHKGMTEERAHEIIRDVSYFGTMMVHLGIADGMVSGAAHTTAHTIRPSFEIIKTAPGVSTVSSVFLMCLADRVLVFGDCAVIPDPTDTQLADVAISSAATAAQFGIDPRVALLSYSTGQSGSGASVDKVRAATTLVRERRPDLHVEGPIQYDAAVEPSVAKTKMPDSPVAGRATVLIFPDLNTGNNTYKAVQRSAGAVAIGPVLQGLAKPVNDLSRGTLVQDIVNTVAITAIQAQGDRT